MYYKNKENIDYTGIDVNPVMKDYNYYDVKYSYVKNTSVGTLVALKAKSVKDAAMRCPVHVTASSIYDPSEVVVLKVELTAKNNLPKEEKL